MFYIINFILSGCLSSVIVDGFLNNNKSSSSNCSIARIGTFGFLSQTLVLFVLCIMGHGGSVLSNISSMTVAFLFKYFALSGLCAVVISLFCPLVFVLKELMEKKHE